MKLHIIEQENRTWCLDSTKLVSDESGAVHIVVLVPLFFMHVGTLAMLVPVTTRTLSCIQRLLRSHRFCIGIRRRPGGIAAMV